MNKLFTLGLAITLLTQSLLAGVDAEFKSPDILVDAQFGYDWSAVITPKVRQVLKTIRNELAGLQNKELLNLRISCSVGAV